MTRPVIDDRGRLFGLVNIIDVIVVQIVVAVGVAGVAFVSPGVTTIAAVVAVVADVVLLAALAYEDNPTDGAEPEDAAEEEDESTREPEVVVDDFGDGKRVGELTLATGQRFDLVLEERESVRTDGGDRE